MEFEWDATQNEANIIKHGLDFVDAEALFESDVYAAKAKDTRKAMARSVGGVSASCGAPSAGGCLDGSVARQATDHLLGEGK